MKGQPHSRLNLLRFPDHPISTSELKQLVRGCLLERGYTDTDEINHHLRAVSDELRDYAEILEEEIRIREDEIDDIQTEIAKLERKLLIPTFRDNHFERVRIDKLIAKFLDELHRSEKRVDDARNRLIQFERDKRQFLLNYIKRQF
jgi:hypothetical protein